METVLIVDDEDSVRRTFQEWLTSSGLPIQVFAVGDAESALLLADHHPIDLAILDWNLGTGSDGLRLLEDLAEFQPDIVAILVTGFAHEATPLTALRMGVRDYLDKNHDLNRETFLRAVSRQLAKIAPAKRQRELLRSLVRFREALEQALPLVRSMAALNDPVPLTEAVRALFRFVLRTVQASSGVLLVRPIDASGEEKLTVFDVEGHRLEVEPIAFARSLAATVLSFQEPWILNDLSTATDSTVELQSFERPHRSLLAAPIPVSSSVQVVLELFDKRGGAGFTEADKQAIAAAAEFGGDLLRQALAERQVQQMLLTAVETALRAGEEVSRSLEASADPARAPASASNLLEQLRAGFHTTTDPLMQADTALPLAEAIRQLAVRHGASAVRHCVRLVETIGQMLDEATASIGR